MRFNYRSGSYTDLISVNITSLIFAVAAVLLWGVWGIFLKLATNYISPTNSLVYSAIGSFCVVIIVFFLSGFKIDWSYNKGIGYSVFAGFIGTLAVLFFIYAISKGKVSVIVSFTSLYPIITLLLATMILGESISIRQGVGVGLALVALLLLSL